MLGIDMFDCVIPTRNARNSQLFTKNGKINIRNSIYKNDHTPIDIHSNSNLSKKYTKSYLHHLFKTNELLGFQLLTLHNVYFMNALMLFIQEAIKNDNLE